MTRNVANWIKTTSSVQAAVGTLYVLLAADILTTQQSSQVNISEEILRQLISNGVRAESLRLRSDGTPDGLSAISVNLDGKAMGGPEEVPW